MKKNSRNTPSEAAENYYDLKTDAVNALVNAETDETEVSQEELDKYQKKGFHVPDFLKILGIKFWFAGVVYYFIGFGLGITNLLDQIVILGVVYGIVTDLLTNNVIRFFEKTPGANDKWLLFSRKSYASFVFHLFYGMFVVACVAGVYWVLEWIADMISGKPELIHVGTEPVLFGLFCAAVDLLFIGIKHLIKKLFKKDS